MLDHMHKAGEFMVGYRYMYGRRDGDMLHGTGTASNAAVMQNACAQTCMMRPVETTMQMHMLDIMYAPTDWLTLMLMPQWMTMDMTMTLLTVAWAPCRTIPTASATRSSVPSSSCPRAAATTCIQA